MKIAIVGEAWGKEEERAWRSYVDRRLASKGISEYEELEEGLNFCFVGSSGRLLDYMLKSAGISREKCLVTNIINKRPKGNKFSNFSKEEIDKGIDSLKRELLQYRPNVVVALGGTALKYLTPFEGITKYRGSVLPPSLIPSGKVLPTYHPAWLLRGQDTYVAVVISDLKKALRESKAPTINYPKRDIKVISSESEALSFLKDLSGPCAVDIETTRVKVHGQKPHLKCIGFSPSKEEAYVLSQKLMWIPSVLRGVAKYLRAPNGPKIFHNATFDVLFLAYWYRILTPVSEIEDTMLMQHACYPNLPKSLAFCASLYTNEPYWKDDKTLPTGEGLYIYNGKDCCLTREIYDVLRNEMADLKVSEVYEFDRRSLGPAFHMSLKGLRVDMEERQELIKWRTSCENNLKRIIEGIFPGLNPNSSSQVRSLLYDELKLPVQKHPKTKRPTVEAKFLRKLCTLPIKDKGIIKLLLKWSEISTLKQFTEVPLEPDGRVRYTINVGGTLSGRYSSNKFLSLSGFNFQNQPKGVRSMYIADPGKVLILVDLSQAEARLTAAHCRDKHWLETFDKEDVHTLVASELFNLSKKAVDPKKRQVAKKVSHGANYCMGPQTLALELLCSIREANRHLDSYYAFRPNLLHWQEEVKSILLKKGEVRTVYGRRLPALINPLRGVTRAFWLQAVSYRPQSECPDYLNRGGLRIYENLPHVELLLQIHDAYLLQVSENKSLVWETIKKIKEVVEVPLTIEGLTFRIPLSVEIGKSWGKMHGVTGATHELEGDLFEEAWKCLSS